MKTANKARENNFDDIGIEETVTTGFHRANRLLFGGIGRQMTKPGLIADKYAQPKELVEFVNAKGEVKGGDEMVAGVEGEISDTNSTTLSKSSHITNNLPKPSELENKDESENLYGMLRKFAVSGSDILSGLYRVKIEGKELEVDKIGGEILEKQYKDKEVVGEAKAYLGRHRRKHRLRKVEEMKENLTDDQKRLLSFCELMAHRRRPILSNTFDFLTRVYNQQCLEIVYEISKIRNDADIYTEQQNCYDFQQMKLEDKKPEEIKERCKHGLRIRNQLRNGEFDDMPKRVSQDDLENMSKKS